MFSKQDRDLKSTIDHRVKLIKQWSAVNLRVKACDKEKVCKFYIVPNTCRPIFGLPDFKKID